MCTYVILVWTQSKVLGHFIVFSYTVPCKEETNMTYKINLIWYHMKTLYRCGEGCKTTSAISQNLQMGKIIIFICKNTRKTLALSVVLKRLLKHNYEYHSLTVIECISILHEWCILKIESKCFLLERNHWYSILKRDDIWSVVYWWWKFNIL